ncbi:meteorin-like protein [Dinothrombium tinctorium]|uniref:Meteorin-like protein n=1 Tax=Dinothrombium tinctorium TaxID=1965070 RepID=A0A3S3NL00_9ACAR|nr:meteorin-like protein [Dinothrombium tinctorium]
MSTIFAFVLSLSLTCFKLSAAKDGVDTCDWEGSGLRDSVIPIDLRCTRGYVKWHYPDGGLRITLTVGTSSGNDFRGYFRIEHNTSSFVIIYVEGFRKLHRLYSRDDGMHPNLVRSFVSHNGKAVIYMESKSNLSSLTNDYLKMSYFLVPVRSDRDLHSDDFECRPCSDQETLDMYCESEIVLEGAISSINNIDELQVSELTVKPTIVHKDLYRKSRLKNRTTHKAKYLFNHPLKCNAKAGLGSKLLIIGQWMLGNPVIRCAPTLTQWKRIRSEARLKNSPKTQCIAAD